MKAFIQFLALTAAVFMSNAFAESSLENDSAEFESFSSGFDYRFNHSIRLIGYKKIKVPESEVSQFEDHYFKHHHEWKKLKNTYYDPETATIRVYFPVEGALVEHGNRIIEANDLGELDLDEEIMGDCAVLGRKQTHHVTGVDGNIIKDGIIYLSDRNRPT